MGYLSRGSLSMSSLSEGLCEGSLREGGSLWRDSLWSGVYVKGFSVKGDRDTPPPLCQPLKWVVRIPLECILVINVLTTKMHSSMMRTTHSLTVSHSVGVCIPCPPPPHMPPATHAPAMHAPATHTPCHTCPLPHMPPAMHVACHEHPSEDRILDTRLWKHYLPATSLRAVNMWYSINLAISLPPKHQYNFCFSIWPMIEYSTFPKLAMLTFKCALWTFKQQLILKMRAGCGISLFLL